VTVPTYEYECLGCGRVFEMRQRISEPALTTCDACGGEVRRLLAPAPFILRGGGWYVTDYPSESRKKAMESERSSSAAGDAQGPSDKPAGGDKPAAPAASGAAAPAPTPAPSTTKTD
jgi:putative FmdB family regulatory protein